MEQENRITKATTDDGKEIVVTETADGKRSTRITVRGLRVNDDTPEGKAALSAINDKILPRLAAEKILVVVLHKPTNESTSMAVPLMNVPIYVREAIRAFPHPYNSDIPLEHFVVIEVLGANGKSGVRVTSALAYYD